MRAASATPRRTRRRSRRIRPRAAHREDFLDDHCYASICPGCLNYRVARADRPRSLGVLLSSLPPETKLITGFNNSIRKPLLARSLTAALEHSDLILFNNRQNWIDAGRLPGTTCLSNGLDSDIFFVEQPIEHRPWKVVWWGSIGARHVKSYDEIVLPLARELANRGILCELKLTDSFHAALTPQEMAVWYNTATHYVCASHYEGTPNTALEAAACGCVVVSTPVGDMPDLIDHGRSGYLSRRSVNDFLLWIVKSSERTRYIEMSREIQQSVARRFWTNVAPDFFALFRKVVSGERADGPSWLGVLRG